MSHKALIKYISESVCTCVDQEKMTLVKSREAERGHDGASQV